MYLENNCLPSYITRSVC